MCVSICKVKPRVGLKLDDAVIAWELESALNEYDQYAVYLAMLNHGTIDMFSVCNNLQ